MSSISSPTDPKKKAGIDGITIPKPAVNPINPGIIGASSSPEKKDEAPKPTALTQDKALGTIQAKL